MTKTESRNPVETACRAAVPLLVVLAAVAPASASLGPLDLGLADLQENTMLLESPHNELDVGTEEPDALSASFGSPPPNDNFATAETFWGHDEEYTDFATVESGEPYNCNLGGRTIWYRFTPSDFGTAHLNTFGSESGFDTVLSVYTHAGGFNLVACNDDSPSGGTFSSLQFDYSAGTVYYIQGGGYSSDFGHLHLSMWLDPDCSANDNWANACALTSGESNSQDTSGATMQQGEIPPHCATGAGSSVWYRFTLPGTGTSTRFIDTDGSNFDTVLAVYVSVAGRPGPPVACDDDSGSSNASSLSFTAVGGTTYLVQASGYSGQQGVLNIRMNT